MTTIAIPAVLDRQHLSEVTLEDEELMRQLLAALIEDTERQLPLLENAVREVDGPQCARLAHYCKGACSNMGAVSAAGVLAQLERNARAGEMQECARQLAALAAEVEKLRAEEI